MSFLNFLKLKKQELEKIDNKIDMSNINISILNNSNLFENEENIIKDGALVFLENKMADDDEDAIITFATMIRGLKYIRTDIDENGNKTIVLEDRCISNNNKNVLHM